MLKSNSTLNYSTNQIINAKKASFKLDNDKLNFSSANPLAKLSMESLYLKSSYTFNYYRKQLAYSLSLLNLKTFSYGFLYLRGLFVILFIDACLTDDEPL